MCCSCRYFKKKEITGKNKNIENLGKTERRNYLGIYNTLVQEFQTEDRFEYSKFLRMLPEHFEELVIPNY